MFQDDTFASFGAAYSQLRNANTREFKDETDVFGDGLVLIKSMPGHTPGSSVLLVRLANAGNVLLSGDLYVHRQDRELQTIPTFTMDQQVIVDSRKRFEMLAAEKKARVIIQHSLDDFESLPKFPRFLD